MIIAAAIIHLNRSTFNLTTRAKINVIVFFFLSKNYKKLKKVLGNPNATFKVINVFLSKKH